MTTIGGRVAAAPGGLVLGRAADTADTARRLDVSLWHDGRRIGGTVADRRLADAPDGTGFVLVLPDAVVRAGATVRVTADDGVDLAGSPVTAIGGIGGCLEGQSGAGLKGWAVDRDGGKPVAVTIRDGGRVVATVLADQFRHDLRDRGVGDGTGGFWCPLPADLCDGTEHRLSATVGDVTLCGGLTIFRHAPRPATLYRGAVTGAARGVVEGWVVNTRVPTDRPMLEVWIGDGLLLVAPCDGADITGRPAGTHGFRLRVPGLTELPMAARPTLRVAQTDPALAAAVLPGMPACVADLLGAP